MGYCTGNSGQTLWVFNAFYHITAVEFTSLPHLFFTPTSLKTVSSNELNSTKASVTQPLRVVSLWRHPVAREKCIFPDGLASGCSRFLTDTRWH